MKLSRDPFRANSPFCFGHDVTSLFRLCLLLVLFHSDGFVDQKQRMVGVQAEFGKPGTAARERLCRCPGRTASVTFRRVSGGHRLHINLSDLLARTVEHRV